MLNDALRLLNDGEITHSQYISITNRYKVKPGITSTHYNFVTREVIVELGYKLYIGELSDIIYESTRVAKEHGVKPGAFIDRVRNVIWLLSKGETGRNNDKWGVSWVEPTLNKYILRNT